MLKFNTSCFIAFKEPVLDYDLPVKFTFPFNYTPHPLSLIASKELQEYLSSQKEWRHNFGLNADNTGTGLGKMFGVLVVKNKDNELGYLAAFSGILANKTVLNHFVPPIFDRKSEHSFYTNLENKINRINTRIEEIQNSTRFNSLSKVHSDLESESQQELQLKKEELKSAKKQRKSERKNQVEILSITEFENLESQHRKESMDFDFGYKRLAKQWKLKLQESKKNVAQLQDEIDNLKAERKEKSALMQKELFEQYNILNIQGKQKNVLAIFNEKFQKTPPAGTGDCAAPKLLQYAFSNQLTPIALAEFWWGKSPKLEVRKHGHFYPACKTKCEPILGHMLQGLEIDTNPVESIQTSVLELDTLYEDEFLLVINKPAELLSVPGKRIKDSVETRMKLKYPNATGPMLAHRLDMSTSGLMVISKSLEIHRNLQSQFVNRTIKKRYLAVLDGNIKHDSGTIELPLRVDIENRPSQIVCFEHGKKAVTRWEVISRNNNLTRIHFHPVTGRTHQLRVHSSHPKGLNTAIVGDDIYGSRSNRLHLQANLLHFRHPITQKQMKFELPPAF